MPSALYFDEQDRALLAMVDRMLAKGDDWDGRQLFATELDPHGLKELGETRELRIAYAVINLLNSLEEGQVADRLHALAALYEEVVSVTGSTFRFNTGRALIQLMKELVRGSGGEERRLVLAHTFRKAARGNRRYVRRVLRHYHLLEMPEEWNQVAFDNHVHDSHTKGRKTSSRLIMDAWVKGIRKLTVIYYNYVDAAAVDELFQAAEIVGIGIQIGIEYRAMFRGRHVSFIWEPPSLDDLQFLESFLAEDSVRALMRDGRAASEYYALNVLDKLHEYNAALRPRIAAYYGVNLAEIRPDEFLRFVGSGQPSLLHLADYVYKEIYALAECDLPAMRRLWHSSPEEEIRRRVKEKSDRLGELSPEGLLKKWFLEAPEHEPSIYGAERQSVSIPPILHISAPELVKRLHGIRRKSNITLTTAGLTPEDVLELLYGCEGNITHLELFNLREFAGGLQPHQKEINALQFAINQGSAVALKQMIGAIIGRYRSGADQVSRERHGALLEILYNIPRLQSFYRSKPIKTRIGSDSTDRSNLLYGMGFVYTETLPRTAVRELRKNRGGGFRMNLPLQAEVATQITYTPRAAAPRWSEKLFARLRKIPGLHLKGRVHKISWAPLPQTVVYNPEAESLTTLGGLRNAANPPFRLEPEEIGQTRPEAGNINTRLVNFLKIFTGFALAAVTFAFTQDWWLMAWLGAPIWFIITGVRNIFQAVLAGRGLRHSSLLNWRAYVDWSRVSDSLLYTGISVPLLELVLRWGVLGKVFGITAASNQVVFFLVVSTANGLYIAGHNLFRGLQKEAVIGNIFRSVLAVPLSLAYNAGLAALLAPLGPGALHILADGAAIVSKAASDTVAGVIEGFADRRSNLDMRHWDYSRKLRQFFACYARLDVLMPEQDTLAALRHKQDPAGPGAEMSEEMRGLELALLIHSLDLMYFLMYQPRSRTMLQIYSREMTRQERLIFTRAQLILTREEEVSQAFRNGEIMRNYGPALAFYQSRHRAYLLDLAELTRVKIDLEHLPGSESPRE